MVLDEVSKTKWNCQKPSGIVKNQMEMCQTRIQLLDVIINSDSLLLSIYSSSNLLSK